MPLPAHDNQADAAQEVVLGVDTRKDTHVAAVVTVLGKLLASKAFPTTQAGYLGYRRLTTWARS